MPENIYQMYVANGNKVGFWVQRNSWSWQTALITSIGGQSEGELEGLPPISRIRRSNGGSRAEGRKLIFPAQEHMVIVALINLRLSESPLLL